MKKVLFIASEAVPFIKTGGLADVAGTLPKYFDRSKVEVHIILPKYACMKQEWKEKFAYKLHFHMDLNWAQRYVGVLEYVQDGITYWFLDNEEYFGGVRPYEDASYDIQKFAFFSKAALSALPLLDYHPDIIHCHDWQSGLVPVYLDYFRKFNPFFENIKTIFTIHNLKFQGSWGIDAVKNITVLPDEYFTSDKLEAYGASNYLKGGVVYADKVTTVSSSYADEIKTPFYGEGLDGLMNARANSLVGIVNGIDYEEFNPDTDGYIAKKYNAENFRKNKVANKLDLQRQLGLEQDHKVMMIGIVSRLTDQKGFDLIDRVMDELCQDAIQIVVLGTGEARYENMFRYFAGKYPNKVASMIFYSEEMSHKVYAACDAFLMPSLFEPCGLSQLMSLRYGTVPIVRETGGLRDTVIPYNEYEETGTGFSFKNYNAHEMMGIVRYSEHIYYDKKREWNCIAERGMCQDFSWNNSARRYEDLYESL